MRVLPGQEAVRRLTVEALRSTIPNLRILFEPFISFQGNLIPWESFNRCILMSVNLGIQFRVARVSDALRVLAKNFVAS